MAVLLAKRDARIRELELENMELKSKLDKYQMIFTGKYITPLNKNYLEDLENTRKDELKIQREKSKASG